MSSAQLNEAYQETGKRNSVSSFWVSVNRRFNQGLAVIAGISLMMMMLLIVSNAVIRVFANPFAGTVEVVGWLMAITTSFAVGYTQLNRGHVDIDLLTSRFSPMVQRGLQAIVQLVSLLFFLVVGWQVIQYGLSLMQNGTLSQTLGVIFYPYVFLVSLGFFGTSFTLAIQLYETWTGGEKRGA
ncbi:TRAP transporter small permease [Ammoniphilus sp. YIM 78166]|uniref:TRAP transporter small permease n=1 Tax=Ammoniphilus sp. YIM 78166 TaxID=1644106 RepID=UPI0010703068|nr:TRAP transporter small permease [Ammoniphilus sp. YIM 78166]